MYETFIDKTFTDETLAIISTADSICREYDRQGLSITLRQLYYQFVARGLLANKQTNYDRLGRIVSDGRLAGMINWSHLEDRTRDITGDMSYVDHSPAESIRTAADTYAIDLWVDQPRRIEVWVEKQALIDVISRAAWGLRVASFACKGYVSQSEMYAAGQRLKEYIDHGQDPLIIHLGDHDPSGLDMTRDIEDRLSMFAGQPIEVRRIALNMDQVRQFNPPPNPAKITDSRVHGYISRYGYESWELDALDPATLNRLVQNHIRSEMDENAFDDQLRIERQRRANMQSLAERWDQLDARFDDLIEWLEG